MGRHTPTYLPTLSPPSISNLIIENPLLSVTFTLRRQNPYLPTYPLALFPAPWVLACLDFGYNFACLPHLGTCLVNFLCFQLLFDTMGGLRRGHFQANCYSQSPPERGLRFCENINISKIKSRLKNIKYLLSVIFFVGINIFIFNPIFLSK